MPTSFMVADRVYLFAVRLAAAGRVFTAAQLAKHSDLSWRSLPEHRAREILSLHCDEFECIPRELGKPHIWRLTADAKKRHGIYYRSVGVSQHTDHWLMVGDVWMTLVWSGNRPSNWFTEGKDIGGFDVFWRVGEQGYLAELQRTPLSPRQWITKWNRRTEWLRKKRWANDAEWQRKFTDHAPKILLVTETPMKLEEGKTIPRGVLHAQRAEDVKRLLTRPQ